MPPAAACNRLIPHTRHQLPRRVPPPLGLWRDQVQRAGRCRSGSFAGRLLSTFIALGPSLKRERLSMPNKQPGRRPDPHDFSQGLEEWEDAVVRP
jgi:hypothetical protein